MDILSIPAEVIDCCVLPHLEWNDLLRFRRVCKWTKAITDGYLKVHPELAPELEIDEEEKSFGAFLQMGIPTNKIFLKNVSGNDFYEEAGEDATQFVEKFGAHVKSLRVDQISMMIFGKEWDFLVGLKNLESFEAGRYGGYHRDLNFLQAREALMLKRVFFRNDPRTHTEDGKAFAFPPDVHKQLKKLKIGNNGLRVESLFVYSKALLLQGESLEHVGLPFDPYTKPVLDDINAANDTPMSFFFLVFETNILVRMKAESSAFKLKVIDFFNYHDANEADLIKIEPAASPFFLRLCSQCVKDDVKLMNVASRWFLSRKTMPRVDSPELGTPIVSLINIHPCVEELFGFFFMDVSRTSLAELKLHFTKEGLPVPKTDHIVSSCPNLKKLTLINWPGTNKALTRLWAGLPNLEEVSLKDCKGLGNVAFVGEDVKSPVFWNLKKLKKLTLAGLDGMPKVTDTLFSLVIRHVKLSHLIITSQASIQSVTLAGVRSLCDGDFAESIEKFPFRGWSLSNVSEEEFQRHEKMFRAYHMR